MYGMRVHEAVLAARLERTAISIHVVDDEYDHGPVIATREIDVLTDDTPESLAERVRSEEGNFLVETLQRIARGEIFLQAMR